MTLLPSPRHARAPIDPIPCHVRIRRGQPYWLGLTGLVFAFRRRPSVGTRPGVPLRRPVRAFDLAALQREAVELVHALSLRLLTSLGRPRLSGPGRLSGRRSLPEWVGTAVSLIRSASLEVSRPFNVCEPCCAIRGGQPSDHSASTFDRSPRRRQRSVVRVTLASLRFFRSASTVRGARHVGSSRFTPARAGHCTAVSLPRGVPLPSLRTLARPGRTASSSVRRRSWDFVDPSQCSLSAGPGVCDTTPFDLGAVGSVSAVHPHLPFSTSFRIPLIFTVVGRAKENLRTPSQRAWLASESSSQASFA